MKHCKEGSCLSGNFAGSQIHKCILQIIYGSYNGLLIKLSVFVYSTGTSVKLVNLSKYPLKLAALIKKV